MEEDQQGLYVQQSEEADVGHENSDSDLGGHRLELLVDTPDNVDDHRLELLGNTLADVDDHRREAFSLGHALV